MTTQVKDALDRANPNTLADGFRAIKLGSSLAQNMKATKRHVDMDAAGANPEDLATLDVLVLPDDAKASTVLRAYARAGTAGVGELAVVAPGATPITGQIAVTPAGNIATLAADAITDMDVEYLGAEGDVYEYTGPVVGNVLAFPAWMTALGVIELLEANATAGTTTGRKVVLAAGGAAAAGQAALNDAKAQVGFAGADAVTHATVKVLMASADGTAADVLEGEAPPLV